MRGCTVHWGGLWTGEAVFVWVGGLFEGIQDDELFVAINDGDTTMEEEQ